MERNEKPPTPQPSSSSSPAAGGGAAPPTPPSAEADIEAAREKAIRHLANDNPDEALKEASKIPGFPTASLMAHAFLCQRAASQCDDRGDRVRLLRTAADYIAEAVSLSPTDIDALALQAKILHFLAASFGGDFEDVIRVCDRALAISDPIDPLTMEDLRNLRNTAEKAAKAREERRKDIEFRVAVARMIQQLDEAALDRHNLDLYSVSVTDLRAQASSTGDPESWNTLLSEALSFAADHQAFKFWACCCCCEKFSAPEDHIKHLMEEHVGSLPPELESVLPQEVPAGWIKKFLQSEWKPLDAVEHEKMNQYTERVELLQKIGRMIEMLVWNNSFSAGHLDEVLRLAMEAIPSTSVLRNLGPEKSNSCICYLDAPQLQIVLNFLEEISQSCGLDQHNEKDSSLHRVDEEIGCQERLILDSNESALILDSHSLKGEPESSDNNGSCDEPGNEPDLEELIDWAYNGLSGWEHLFEWTHAREVRSDQSNSILQSLKGEFDLLKGLGVKKCEQMSYKEAWNTTTIIFQELKKKADVAEPTREFCEAALEKHQQELDMREDMSSRFVKDTLSQILKEANASETSESVGQANNHIQGAIQKQKDHFTLELNKIDAHIMQTRRTMQQLEINIGFASVFNYQTVLMPIVKSSIKMRIEGFAVEDAAIRALLEKVKDDAQSNISKGDDDPKKEHGKSKKKKKKQRSRKGRR